MPLEFVTGRSKSGKTKYIYTRISSLVTSGEEVILIVPEQFTHSAERHLLELVDTIGEGGVEVFSFAHLASKSEGRMGFAPTDVINPVVKALIIKQILTENDFSFYKNAGVQTGFTDMLSGTFDEFQKYMITPDVLESLSHDADSPVLRMKLNDLSVMYKEYEKRLCQLYSNSGDSLALFAKRLEKSDLYSKKHIFFDGFDSFVPQEIEIIKALHNTCRSVTVALCVDAKEQNTTLFMPTSDTADKLAKALGCRAKTTVMADTHFATQEMSHLEKNLYSFGKGVFGDKTENIHVFGLANPLSEVENCAQKIKKLVYGNGYRYKDIAVACSDIDMYQRHIERVLDYADIEYFVDVKNDVINHHLVRFVLGLLEIYTDDYSYSSVFNYLKTSFVDAQPSHISLLERFIQRTGIRRSGWLSDEKWNSILSVNYKDDETSKEILNDIRKRYILPLAQMHEQIKGRNTVKHHAKALFDYIQKLGMPKTISSYIEMFEAMDELRLAKEYEKIWEVIVNTLDQVVLLNPENKVSPNGFYELLVTAFAQQKVGFIPSTVDRVLVGNIERTRFEGVKVLFVLGANEGIFPVSPKPDGLLGDYDKEIIKNKGVDFSVTSSVSAYYSQYRAYRTMTTPSEKLYVSYSKSGNDFKTLRKSYVVDRLLKMFEIKEETEIADDDINSIYALGPARETLCKNIARYLSGNEIGEHWRELYDYFFNKTDFTNKIESFRKSDNIARKISPKNLEKLIPMLSYTSVSKLERYMTCRYAYFIDYIMRIETPKDAVVDALDIGNITHFILEKLSLKFASSMSALNASSDDEIIKSIDEMLEGYMEEFSMRADELSPRDSYTIKRLKSSIYLCFNAVKRQLTQSDFEPYGYEIEFNENSSLGAIDILTGDGKNVKLTGKIDRADICRKDGETYIRVIDYKTGSKELKLDDVFYGLNMQLMVYLSKLVAENENARHGGALYFPVSDVLIKENGRVTDAKASENIESALRLKGIIPSDENILSAYDETLASSAKRAASMGKGVTLDGFQTIDAYLKKKLGEICKSMLDGDFEISPYKKSNYTSCDYCKYAPVCRFDPSCRNNDYKFYKAMTKSKEIIKEMEEELNVDTESADGN